MDLLTYGASDMKRIIAICCTIGITLSAQAVFAQGQDQATPEQFIPFEGMVIDGAKKDPATMIKGAQKLARFSRLSSLKRSFLTEVQSTAHEVAR